MDDASPHTREVDRPPGAESPADDDDLTYLFDDGYWDDAFSTMYDPAMRVCSVFGC